MRAARVPLDPHRRERARQHRLSERDAGERHRVEAAEGMKRIALDAAAGDGRVEKREIEARVVTDEDRALAVACAQRGTHLAEDALERIAFRQRRPQRMMWIDAGDLQRRRVEASARKGLYVMPHRRAAAQLAVGMHVDDDGGDL